MGIARRPFHIVATVLLVVVVSMAVHWVFTGYRTFAHTESDSPYSFEYPASFRRTVHNPIGVRYEGSLSLANWLSDDHKIVLMASVEKLDSQLLDPMARADRILSVGRRELLERSTAAIGGVPCELLTFYEYPYVYKCAFFEYEGHACELCIYGRLDYREEVEAVFEHTASTFSFLP